MKKIFLTIVVVAVVWIGWLLFLELTNANTWMSYEAFQGATVAGALISIGIIISTIFREIKKKLSKKN